MKCPESGRCWNVGDAHKAGPDTVELAPDEARLEPRHLSRGVMFAHDAAFVYAEVLIAGFQVFLPNRAME